MASAALEGFIDGLIRVSREHGYRPTIFIRLRTSRGMTPLKESRSTVPGMTDGLQLVAIRATHTGTMIIGMVRRTQTGCAFAGAAMGECGGMEGIDRFFENHPGNQFSVMARFRRAIHVLVTMTSRGMTPLKESRSTVPGMTDGLQLVAIRATHTGTMIIGMVRRTQTGCAFAGAAMGECGGMEGIDRFFENHPGNQFSVMARFRRAIHVLVTMTSRGCPGQAGA